MSNDSIIFIFCTGKNLIDLELDSTFDQSLFSLPKPLLKFGGLESIRRLIQSLQPQNCRILVDQEYFLIYEQFFLSFEFPLEHLYCTGKVRTKPWFAYIIHDLDFISRLGYTRNLKVISGDFLPLAILKETWVDDEAQAACIKHSEPILALELASSILTKFHEIWEYVHMREHASVSQYDMLIEWLDELTRLNDFEMEPSVAKEWLSQTVTLESYKNKFIHEIFTAVTRDALPVITHKVYARVGLVGNPSDGISVFNPGFFGKTISCTIKNFFATTNLIPNLNPLDSSIKFVPHSASDSVILPTILAGKSWIDKNGYNGIHRLFLATLHVLVTFTRSNGIPLKPQGFTIFSKSNIPRQVGLAGSSALVISILKSLISYYGIQINTSIQANLALAVEQEQLGIAAGYQDRVVQVYDSLVYMDFKNIAERGIGEYSLMPVGCLPRLWIGNLDDFLTIAFDRNPKDSGKVHSDMMMRFRKGDRVVVEAMRAFASFADEAHDVLLKQDYNRLAELFRLNYQCRKELYGNLGQSTMKMVEIANAHGHAAKLTGSGGCVVGMPFNQNAGGDEGLRGKLEREGFIFTWIEI